MTCFTPLIEMEASALYLRIKLGRWCNHQAAPRLFYDIQLVLR